MSPHLISMCPGLITESPLDQYVSRVDSLVSPHLISMCPGLISESPLDQYVARVD